ncbi:Lactosylceramide 4-alpha-galactosyltransferase [Achaetomium macrosporum]|uniref:Lactosylceramide 4-alpha-galactosyltransferase n=1 Tax=Achaetomium macrosporum TaxID=79813 RepID=A0AAN7H8W3_9PEZI|nr:Lactosylceramide 4-alpha-galactosyltransferase [Achaetomium macrosporum]
MSPRVASLALCVLTLIVLVTVGRYPAWAARFSYRTFEFVSQRAFKFFVSIYSAHTLWRLERIYIHTDAAPDVVSLAQQSGTLWTRRILAIPNLQINQVEAPQRTNKGVGIKTLAHKADFVRLAALHEHGGVYLDTDAVPIRDVAELRNSGFRNVIGQQLGLGLWVIGHLNNLNNGVMMAVPRSNLITLFYHAAHEFFDGQWDTASIQLLTDLGNRLASLPSEVLILQPQAFSPISWQDDNQKCLLAPSLDPATATTPASEQREETLRGSAAESGMCRDVLVWLKYREKEKGGSLGQGTGVRPVGALTEIDFSSSYVLHAFDSALDKVLGKGEDIDVRYVLSRESNYARAVFPAVWRAVEEGIIPKEEIN